MCQTSLREYRDFRQIYRSHEVAPNRMRISPGRMSQNDRKMIFFVKQTEFVIFWGEQN